MVNTGPGEEPLAEAIAAGTGGAATPLSCTLAQLIALTRRVSLVIAGDTGPLHLACALGRPVVGIYGPTDPSRNGPYGARFRVLRSLQSRRDHTRHASPEAGLLTIQPDDVLQAAGPASERGGCADEPDPVQPPDWIARWQQIARRIRVPLGFLTAALYLFELLRRAPHPTAVAWSLALVLPGLWLRGYAAGYVKKNRELTVTGPYAHTRNPLYLGSMLMAAGFALALLSWPVALALAVGFAVIYIPVIASEERFLRGAFPDFDAYCRRVPRLIPRLTPARPSPRQSAPGAFSFALYLKHREYNAAMGVALLYLSLLFLRPVFAVLVRVLR